MLSQVGVCEKGQGERGGFDGKDPPPPYNVPVSQFLTDQSEWGYCILSMYIVYVAHEKSVSKISKCGEGLNSNPRAKWA